LWLQLCEAGLASGDLPVAAEPPSPWPVRAMLGIAGWLGALFLLGFAGMTFAVLFRDAQAALPAGLICCGAAFAAFRAGPRSDFVSQFGFATSLAGQALILVGLGILFGDRMYAPMFLAMAVAETLLTLAMPNYVHRVFTTFGAVFCFSIATVDAGVPGLAPAAAAVGAAVVWLDPVRMAERPSLWEPLGYGFAIALIELDGALLFGSDLWREFRRGHEAPPVWMLWASQAVAGLVFVYVVWRLATRAGLEPRSRAGVVTMAAAIIFALCGLAAPGVAAAVLVLVLGFANGNRVLMGLGMLAFGVYLSHFYYQLSFTLLVKSVVLAATGAALLAVRWGMERWLAPEGRGNA
jgi:hypothetical protein